LYPKQKAMSIAPRIVLSFEGTWLEVESSVADRRGCLRILAREAESKWNLQPNLYEFKHASGKVDSQTALQCALQGARHGICRLEIVEHLESKMMRAMQTEMRHLEERVMAKVEAALTDVRHESGLNRSRLVSSIAPIVQCMAVEQIELRNKLNNLTMQQDSPALKDAEALEQELQQECAMQAACDLDLSATDDHEELKKEVGYLSQKQNTALAKTIPSGPQTDSYSSTLHWPMASVSGIPYSSKTAKGSTMLEAKWHPGEKWCCVKLGDQATGPFAQSPLGSQYSSKALSTHRSCPLLPPLL
jgi:hypothetical protein